MYSITAGRVISGTGFEVAERAAFCHSSTLLSCPSNLNQASSDGVDAGGAVVLQKKLHCGAVLNFLSKLEPA